MDCMRIQSSLSLEKNWKYDVFVSFRGETRFNFTDHLYLALHRHGIVAFRDDTRLQKGGPTSAGPLEAIERSQVLIVVFSINYASSTWCLQELAKIADCIETRRQRVLPIFYDVSPTEVRRQSGNYEAAFMKHEERFKDDAEMMEQVRRWRAALTQVADLSGWDLKNDRSQLAVIENIVKLVTSIVSPKPSSSLSDDIVGMHSPLQELEKLLLLDSEDDVRVVGICGMGGIGKSTLAKILYEKISHQYDASCFVEDVSRIYRGYGPVGVQKQLLCQAFMEENFSTCNLSMASNVIQTRLRHRKVLIVLDNVDEGIQLEKLAIKWERLGRGSRIIIVSRDEHILREYGADDVYKVPLLNDENALQLFCRKAFKCNQVAKDYESLTNSALKYANGHPLAIGVLGSFLFGRNVSECSSALVRLKEKPTKDILDVLRISFDALEDMEKEIYSDFSSFKDTVTLDSSSEIEETESKGSRLPLAPLLSSDTTEAFSGMHNQVEADIIPKTIQKKDTQSSFGKADIPITPQADDLPVKVENLVTEDLDELRSSFETLKVSTVPQLKSLSSNLHSLKIEGCESLEALPDDLLAGTPALKELYLISCCSLKSFPYPAASLTTLYMRNCRRMRFLPSSESRKKLASLEHLFIGSSCDSLTTLTLDSFCKLKILCIWDCHNLQSVNVTREFKGDLASLESLEIRDCPRLRFLPDGGLHTPNLESILISNCKNLNALPSGMNFLTSLKTLFLNRCPEIESLPLGGLPSSLIVLSIAYCDKLIPQEDWGLCSLESLRRFELEGGCMGMESFPDEFFLPCNINSLRISTLNSLKKLNHKGLQHLNVLQTLEIHGCNILQSLPDQGLPSSLINLCVQECLLLTPRLKPKRGKEWHKVAHIPNIQIDHQIVSAH